MIFSKCFKCQFYCVQTKTELFICSDKYEIGAYGYGKNNVKLLYVKREDKYHHEIREYEVDIHLRLGSQRDYLVGDNRDIIATDSQKNTVYLLAKKYGVKSPEEFGILLCAHFLYTYKHVEEVHVNVEEYPWMRHQVDGVPHNHAFIFNPTTRRYCQVTQLRNGNWKIGVCMASKIGRPTFQRDMAFLLYFNR